MVELVCWLMSPGGYDGPLPTDDLLHRRHQQNRGADGSQEASQS